MALTIDLIRHGHALPMDGRGDRHRSLSPQGTEELGRLAHLLTDEGWQPDRIFSSPYRRAVETAGIVSRASRTAVPVEPLEALEPGEEPHEVLRALAFHGIAEGHVVIVGHQPLLGRLVAHLTGAELGLAPGTLVRIHCPQGTVPGGGTIVRTVPAGGTGGA